MDYSRFNFPAYEYHEFPKWVATSKGDVLAKDADEEAAILKSDTKSKKEK
jgi:hypothetical protein